MKLWSLCEASYNDIQLINFNRDCHRKVRIAKVVPIYEKDNAEKFSNYRPVSLLPCLSKILEGFKDLYLTDVLNIYINDKQFGFRPNHSTYGYHIISW